MRLQVTFAQETDGRWIADVPAIPGVTTYGASRAEAFANVRRLALEVVSERMDHGEDIFTGHKKARAVARVTAFRLEITPAPEAVAV